MKYQNIREEELKNRVGQDFFGMFDHAEIIKDIDFAVKNRSKGINPLVDSSALLWAEAKKDCHNVITMLTQLVLTIGKSRVFDKPTATAVFGLF